MRRRAFLIATAGLLAWTAYGCLVEVYRCGWARFNDPWPEPSRWHIASGHVEEMRDFLRDEVEPHLPEGAAVAVSSELEPESERFFQFLWIAYLLPEHDVRFAHAADFRIVFDADSGWILQRAGR